MAAFSSRQWIAITGSVILFASLYFINRKAPAATEQGPAAGGHATATVDFADILKQAEQQVPENEQGAIDKMVQSLDGATTDAQIQTLKNIISRYDSIGAVIPGTYYAEKLAAMRNSADLWYKAAERYYNASEVGDQQARATLIQKAADCYKSSFKIDSTNLDTRVGMGKCLVEGSANPMQGIAIIEGVLKKDSDNINGQLALGELSVQSGQLDKAVYRFKRVLTINPSFSDGYLFLADVYEKKGNNAGAVECLEKYSTFATDLKIKEEVDTEIKRLKNDTITNKQ